VEIGDIGLELGDRGRVPVDWDEIKFAMESSPQFCFDFFFRSRTPQDIERRCNTLLRLIEKEQTDAGVDVIAYADHRPEPPKKVIWPADPEEAEETMEESKIELIGEPEIEILETHKVNENGKRTREDEELDQNPRAIKKSK